MNFGKATMNRIYVEVRELEPNAPLTPDLARHFLTREREGIAIVVTEKVDSILPAFAKRWKRLIIAMQVERSSTLNARRIQMLNRQIKRMERLRFFRTFPTEAATAGIYFIGLDQMRLLPPLCATVYVLGEIDKAHLEEVHKDMPAKSLLVLYQK